MEQIIGRHMSIRPGERIHLCLSVFLPLVVLVGDGAGEVALDQSVASSYHYEGSGVYIGEARRPMGPGPSCFPVLPRPGKRAMAKS